MSEVVYINCTGPLNPDTRDEWRRIIAQVFLAELYKSSNPELKATVSQLCFRWNVHYVEPEIVVNRFLIRYVFFIEQSIIQPIFFLEVW